MEPKKNKGKDVDLDQQVSFLKKINFFDNFDDNELRQFLTVSRWLKVPKDTLIIKEETVERIFYILVKGKVSVFKTIDKKGNTVELTTLTTGDCFGEMSLVTAVKRTAGVKTLKDSFILMVEPDIISTSNVFLQLKFYKRFCEILVNRLIMANERMISQDAKEDEGPSAAAPQEKKPAADKDLQPDFVDETTTMVPRQKVDLATLPPMPSKDDRIPRVSIQRRIKPDLNFAVNPAVASQLSPILTSKEASNNRRIAELVGLDPTLSLEILHVANSSYFRRSNPVASVGHAIVTLGIDHIKKIIEETLQASKPMQIFSGFSSLSHSFWFHSVVVARISEMLREIIRIETVYDVSIAGLLHDIGMLSLDAIKPHFYPQLLRPDSEVGKNLIEAEKEYIGIDHGRAGNWLGEKLGLPEAYLDVMRYHHMPEAARENIVLVALVHLADLFAGSREVYIGGATSHLKSPMESTAWAMIQEHHRPFMEVNVYDFVRSFDAELTKSWNDITAGIL